MLHAPVCTRLFTKMLVARDNLWCGYARPQHLHFPPSRFVIKLGGGNMQEVASLQYCRPLFGPTCEIACSVADNGSAHARYFWRRVRVRVKKVKWGVKPYNIRTDRMETRRLSEYEIARLERIKENKRVLEELFPEGTGLHLPTYFERTPEKDGVTPNKKASTRRNLLVNVRCNPSRKARPKFGEQAARRPHTRSVSSAAKHSLVEGLKDDQDLKRRVYSSRSRNQRLSAKETEALSIELDGVHSDPLTMKKVAQRVKSKTYDKINGTTCHQCRQKTLDQKTVCHNKNCIGIRGQFCGPCLRNRYGECARESLQDNTWVCPPCRGICNCSFCLPKKGRPPTGIMIHQAKEAGFDSVREYLEKSRY